MQGREVGCKCECFRYAGQGNGMQVRVLSICRAGKRRQIRNASVWAQVKRIMGSGLVFWLASLFFQDWTGRETDVTVSCPTSLLAIFRCITNPTQAEFDALLIKGERAIWPALSAIKCHCKVAITIGTPPSGPR